MSYWIPNAITSARVVGSMALVLLDANVELFTAFWVIYTICGLSDIADGCIARRFNAVTRVGALLDSYADIIFVACCAYKLWPFLVLPSWLWIWIGAITVIKVINQISAWVVHRRPVFPHTLANKLTGLLLLITLPLFVCFEQLLPLYGVAVLATFAAIQEGHVIRTS